MIIIGIDNGLRGGIAIINGSAILKTPMPVIAGDKPQYDLQNLVKILKSAEHVFVEKVQAMPWDGKSGCITVGRGAGIVAGICAALNIPITEVGPKTWQKEMFADLPKSDTKQMSYLVCQRLWPREDWRATSKCKKPHDGMCDAALIGEYGRRKIAPQQKTEEW